MLLLFILRLKFYFFKIFCRGFLFQKSRCYQATNFRAPLLDFFLDGVAHFAGLGQFFRALKTGRIGKGPVQPRRDAGKNRAAFRARLVANGDDVGEHLAGLDHVEHRLGLVAGNINADLLHHLDDDGIEPAGFESGAVRLKFVAADLVQERLGHLAACAVVDADE
jgi:hypothetical protein